MMERDHRSQKEAQISDIEAELKYMISFLSLEPHKTKNPKKVMKPTLKQETRRKKKTHLVGDMGFYERIELT